jgi:hypothetical protein
MAAKRVVVARQAFFCEHEGREVHVPQGKRYAATDKLVKAHSIFFEPVDQLDEPVQPRPRS